MLCIAGGFLGGYQSRESASGVVDPVSSSLRKVMAPVSGVMLVAGDGVSGFFSGVASASRLRAENQRLKDELAAMHSYSGEVRAWREQAESARLLLDLPPFGESRRVYGRILTYTLGEGMVVLDIGSNDGVRPGYAVVTGRGLMGVVDAVEADTCQALLITSPQVQVGAKVIRDVPLAGLVQGETANRLELSVVENTPMEVNDKVVTSGFSTYIPPNIPIGEITEVINREELGIRLAKVFPYVRVGASSQAAVLIP